jgi:serine/threonine protein kinase
LDSHWSSKRYVLKIAFLYWDPRKLSVSANVVVGLSHLHSLVPPLIHMDFKTSNVLVDENFIAKVADAGLIRLLRGPGDIGPSHGFSSSVYQDPE